MAATVNKGEMARLLGISLPTFDNLLKTADVPVASGGSRGVAYAFDPAKVIAWRAEEMEKARQVLADKSEFLAAFELPLDDAPDQASQTPAQRVQTARALKIEREMAQQSGLLVPTAGVRQALQTALAALGRRLDALPEQLGREFNLPDPVRRALRVKIDESRALMVREIQTALTEPSPDEQRRFA